MIDIQSDDVSGDHEPDVDSIEETETVEDSQMSKGTAESIGIDHHRLNIVKVGKQFTVGDFIVLPFPTEHDAAEPLGFLIQCRPTGEKLLFATETYYIRHKFNELSYILIECNYCRDTLDRNELEMYPF